MIKVQRGECPEVLQRNAAHWRAALLAASSPAGRKRCEGRYRHPQIKKTLVRVFHGKCAYCESRITHADFGHIEHFHPKAGSRGDRRLTFEWKNLLLACGVCNGAGFKGTQFPAPEEGGPLVNPCDEEPSEHFAFEYESQLGLASVWGITQRGETTERILGLNRTDLRQYRSLQIKKLAYIAMRATQDPQAAKLFQEAQQASSEYAAFARSLAETLGRLKPASHR